MLMNILTAKINPSSSTKILIEASSLGILLSALIRMKKYGVLLADGSTIKNVDKEWTTEKLVFEIVRPNSMNLSTNQQWTIFTDIVKDRSLISPTDFEAVFVSHAWAYNFVELLGILEKISDGTYTTNSSKDITPEYIDKEIPNGLDDMYRYLLKPLKEYLGNDKFNKAFSTILASRVPLNIDIWKQILGYSDNIGNNSNDNKGEMEFMKLKKEFNHLFLFGDDVVRVVHKSQTEYLEKSEHGLSNGLRINRVDGHKYLGLLCDEISNKYCDEYYDNKHQRPLKLPDYVDDHISFSIEHSGYHLASMVDDKDVSNKEKLIELSSNYLLDLKMLIMRIHLENAKNIPTIVSDCSLIMNKIKLFDSSSLPTNIKNNLKLMLQILRFEGASKILSKDALSFAAMIQARTINSPAAKELYKKSEEYLEQIMKVKYWKATRPVSAVAIFPDGNYVLTG